MLFYKKSPTSNSLRWLKTDGSAQRVATALTLSGDWTTITGATKLAGAGGELVFHNMSGTLKATSALLVNNDTTVSQKTNANFVSGYDLATKRTEGKVIMLNGATGAWVAGGWGAATWAQDANGTLTLPSGTTFEHFHRCGTASYIFYSTNDTALHTRVFNGTDFGVAASSSVPASSHAVCVGTNENFTFVYAASTGAANLYSGSTLVANWTTLFATGWTHVVNLRNGTTLFYNASNGAGAVGQFTATTPWFAQLGNFAAGTFPTGMDLVTAL